MSFRTRDFLKKIYLLARHILLTPFLSLRNTRAPQDEEIRKILFLRHDGVGDMVLTTPAFKALKIRYPLAHLTVIASDRNFGVILNNPHIDEILTYKNTCRFINKIRSENFDLAIDPFLTYKSGQAFLAYLSGAKYRMGFEMSGREVFFNIRCPEITYNKKMIDQLLDLVGSIGAKVESREPEIFLTDEEKLWSSACISEKRLRDGLKIAVHPGAFYPIRMWPAERFGEVVRNIVNEYEASVLIFGDKSDESILKSIQDIAGKNAAMFCNLQLRQFMALLNRCNLLICNNSGPLHIASALKIPTVSMVGPSIIPLWLPYGNNIVLRKELPCSPCNKVECKDHSCMKLITTEEVMEAVIKQLDGIKQSGLNK